MPIPTAMGINTRAGFMPFEGDRVVDVGVGITWLDGMSFGVGRTTAGLEGGTPFAL